jgi:hypothetical protein
MSRATLARQLEEKYPCGMSRAAIARELHISKSTIPVERLTAIYLGGLKRPRYAASSVASWVYARYKVGVFK